MKINLSINDKYLERVLNFIHMVEGGSFEDVGLKYLKRGVETFHPFVEKILNGEEMYFEKDKENFTFYKPKDMTNVIQI